MSKEEPLFPGLQRWAAAAYAVLAVAAAPWTLYVGLTLPSRHLSRHWDISWVGLDIAIGTLLVLNAIFSHIGSKWLVMTATATATLLFVDGWFDVMSARSGEPFLIAVVMALFIELPLAFLTLGIAMKLAGHEAKKGRFKG